MAKVWDTDKLIRVDMTTLSVAIVDYPEEWKYLGGRSLSARILLAECDPKCDPLGPDNRLILAAGYFIGHLRTDLRPFVGGVQEPPDRRY